MLCESTLNPNAKPFTRPLHIKHMSDFLTFSYMTFCMILSLSMNLNWIIRANRPLFDILSLSEIGVEKCSILLDNSFNLESWNESIATNISEIPLIVDIATPNITECDELDTTKDHSIASPTNLNPLADPFTPFLSDLSLCEESSSGSIGNVSLSDANDLKSVLTGLKETNLEHPGIAHELDIIQNLNI